MLSLVRLDAAVQELQDVGIGAAVSTEQPGWPERARALVGEGQILRGLACLGGEGPSQLGEVMADGGTTTSFGAMTARPLQIPPGLLLFLKMTVNGFWAAQPSLPAHEIGRMVGVLVRDAAQGRLELPVGGIYRLEEIEEAIRATREAGRVGKVLLRT